MVIVQLERRQCHRRGPWCCRRRTSILPEFHISVPSLGAIYQLRRQLDIFLLVLPLGLSWVCFQKKSIRHISYQGHATTQQQQNLIYQADGTSGNSKTKACFGALRHDVSIRLQFCQH